VVRLRRRSAAVVVTRRHLPVVAVAVEAAAVTDRSLCQLRNVVRANKDPPDRPDLPETREEQERMEVMVKTEVMAKMELSEKRMEAALMDMVMEMEEPNRRHLARCARPDLRVPQVPQVPKDHPDLRVPLAALLVMVNEENAVKLVRKARPVVRAIPVPKAPTAILVRLIPSKAQPVPPVQPAKKVPKVPSDHQARMVNPVMPAVEAVKAKMVMPVLPANPEHPGVRVARVRPDLRAVATIVQLLVRLPDIRSNRLETIDPTHDKKIFALFLFMIFYEFRRISKVDF